MTANEIIKEIKRLNPKEQMGVIRFAYQLDAERRLTGEELSGLAERMVNATDPMVRGFYSATAGRTNSGARRKRAIAKRNRNKHSAKRL